MLAGKLDRRIRVLRYGMTRDAQNAPVEAWAELVKLWASKEDISDGERMRAAQVGASVTTRFRIRYSSVTATIDAKDRIVYGGLVYDIAGIKEIGRREGLEITASAATDEVAE